MNFLFRLFLLLLFLFFFCISCAVFFPFLVTVTEFQLSGLSIAWVRVLISFLKRRRSWERASSRRFSSRYLLLMYFFRVSAGLIAWQRKRGNAHW